MALKLLIDECCALPLVDAANARGVFAQHVVHVGLAGAKDWDLREHMLNNDTALVTNNGKDFVKLLGEADVHPGLIILLPNVRPAEQVVLLEAALDHLEGREDLVNRVVEVQDASTVQEYDLPPAMGPKTT